MTKDLFSSQAKQYALYRPSYPEELFAYIVSFVQEKKTAWDCATGNGQAALRLAGFFDTVEATDLSAEQLQYAAPHQKIHYRESTAEETPFADNSFDLITIASAYHWLNWPLFHKEATRVGRNGCVVAAWCYYTLLSNDEKLNELYHHFYYDVIRPYWDPERKYVEDQYRTVSFEFRPLPVKPFEVTLEWTKEQFTGYLFTWSATQKFIKLNNSSPIDIISTALDELWNEGETKKITFPLSLRLGMVSK